MREVRRAIRPKMAECAGVYEAQPCIGISRVSALPRRTYGNSASNPGLRIDEQSLTTRVGPIGLGEGFVVATDQALVLWKQLFAANI